MSPSVEAATQPLTDRGWRTRGKLLVAAEEVFRERGYAATRMQDVAAAAGVSHGTVYTWFAAKEDLLTALAEALREQVFAGSAEPRAEAVPVAPYARLHAANRRFLDAYAKHARMLSVIEEAASADPAWFSSLEELRQAYVDRTARALRRWREQGLVSSDVDPDMAAVALTGMVETFARRVVAPEAAAATTRSTAEAPSDSLLDGSTDLITRLWAGAVGIAVPSAHDAITTDEPIQGSAS